MKRKINKDERITYARKNLIELIEKRELLSWCKERGLPHSTVYSVAVGTLIPPFTFICKMIPYFSPAEWVYFTDEEIPYEHKTLPAFNPKDFSVFIKKHRIDYMDIASELGISEVNAKNIFRLRRANLSIAQIRKFASKVDPAEFFTPADETDDGMFYPERGDIVTLSGKNILVLSSNNNNVLNACFVGVILDDESDGSVFVKGKNIEGYASIRNMSSFTYARRNPELIDKANEETVIAVLKVFRTMLD